MNEKKELLPEDQRFALCSLISNCADFKEEKSAMEVFLQELPFKSHNNQKIELFVSPKYHCELAGEGVEYAWGMMKQYFQSLSLDKKNTKAKFDRVVRETVEYLCKQNIKMFSMRCQRYMMAYSYYIKNDKLTYTMIERFVKVSKTHRDIGDQEKGFIQKVKQDSISL